MMIEIEMMMVVMIMINIIIYSDICYEQLSHCEVLAGSRSRLEGDLQSGLW